MEKIYIVEENGGDCDDNCHYMDRYSIVIKEYELNKTYNWYDSLPK